MCQWHLGRLDLLFVVLETSSSSQCLGVPGGKYELFDHFSYVNYNLIARTWVSRSFYSFSYVLTIVCNLSSKLLYLLLLRFSKLVLSNHIRCEKYQTRSDLVLQLFRVV